jgi:cytochrome c biogenesis protein CcdA
MIALGVVLMVPRLQTQLAAAGGPLSNWSDRRFGGRNGAGLPGQFAVGLLLGAVWSRCVGQTLGAASLLAAKGENLAPGRPRDGRFRHRRGAAAVAARPPLARRMNRWRDRLISVGYAAKATLGALFIAIGVLVLTGLDKSVETALVNASPAWLTALTTRY